MNIADYGAVIISLSGGKDSQVCMDVIHSEAKRVHYSGELMAIHADTGGEWPQTSDHCRYLAAAYGIKLRIVQPGRLLPDMIEARCRRLQLEGRKGGWPSAACRYCTSDCKRNPIQKEIRHLFDNKQPNKVLMVTGERREESPRRAKYEELIPVTALRAGRREVLNWRPILDYPVGQVWSTITTSGSSVMSPTTTATND